MISRVTHQTVQKSTLANLQMNLDRMSRLQGQMSGGKVITRPSDDPGGTAAVLQLRSDKRAAEQHSRNIDNGLGWLGSVDSALTTSLASLRRVRDLTVQGANSASSAQAREAIAVELEGIRDAMLSEANTTHLGRSVFAGTSDARVAFTGPADTPPYSWTGVAGASVDRRVTADTTIRVDVSGAVAYGEGEDSVFALIDSIAAGLRAGDNVAPMLDGVDDRMKAMLGELGSVGTRYGQLETAQRTAQKTLMDIKGQISGIEDIDLAEVIVELQSQEVAYQAALGATARVLQPSLLDFLR